MSQALIEEDQLEGEDIEAADGFEGADEFEEDAFGEDDELDELDEGDEFEDVDALDELEEAGRARPTNSKTSWPRATSSTTGSTSSATSRSTRRAVSTCRQRHADLRPAAVAIAQRLNPSVLQAMDADDAEAFFRRIGRGLRRSAAASAVSDVSPRAACVRRRRCFGGRCR